MAIVTGAGRGLGRSHALRLAAEGAGVVVNDLGVALDGAGVDRSPAEAVVAEIRATGGRAIASHHDVADWTQAGELVDVALAAYGRLDVLVNNAGILRDRTLANMSEAEWDSAIRVLLKGHAAPTRHAVAHWRDSAKAGQPVAASVIHTSSVSGLFGSFGQANYAAAKLAVLALSRVVCLEAGRYGVRSNAIAPSARTRMSMAGELDPPPAVPANGFDAEDPCHVSTLVAWLAGPDCPATSQVFHLHGRRLTVLSLPPVVHALAAPDVWTLEALDALLPSHLVEPIDVDAFLREH